MAVYNSHSSVLHMYSLTAQLDGTQGLADPCQHKVGCCVRLTTRLCTRPEVLSLLPSITCMVPGWTWLGTGSAEAWQQQPGP